jgi:hypothetical protein
MNETILNRRDLNRLALAALGGLASGMALTGCGSCADANKNQTAAADKDRSADDKDPTPRLLQDPHVCRGINTCKNKGKSGTTNDCVGQGHCATVSAHSCNATNDCKGQGGCQDNPGENTCRGKGACAVPLEAGNKMTWQKARKRFEELMTKAGTKFGEAPAM